VNPQQVIDGSDKPNEEDGEDEYALLMNDGIGLDGDQDEDEDDEIREGDRGTSTTRRPLPQWLMSLFSEKLAESEQRDQNGLPPLYYRDQSFWFLVFPHSSC